MAFEHEDPEDTIRAAMRRIATPASLAVVLALAPPASAERFRLLNDAQEAARVRVRMIHEAQTSIDAMYFIVGDDSVSLAVLTLLRDASRRGIETRLVVDGHFNRIPKEVQARLIAEGVEIREYHPFRLYKPRWWTRRLHDKLLVTDGARLVTGGRNIESPYYGRGEEVGRRDYLDSDAWVEGASAANASAYFDALWNGPKVRKTNLSQFKSARLEKRCELLPAEADRDRCERLRAEALADLDAANRLLDEHRDRVERNPWFTSDRPVGEGSTDVGPVRFVHDPAAGKSPGDGIGAALLERLDRAERSVVIESPYLVPSKALREGLKRAVTRGVRVRILTNSLAVTDNLLAQAGYVGDKDNVVRWGIELWEYAGPECLHSKSAVFDERWLVVGSFNLDPRSEFLNTETAVIVDDPDAARVASAAMDGHLARAYRIDERGRPIPGPVAPEEVGFGKRVKLGFLRLLAPFIRKQI
jgi:phosphatidylserine/phosphatidylglycerophosphate/cardiolipin synthase-like enzyme